MRANRRGARATGGLVAVMIWASIPAFAADPSPGRGGGLVPGASAPPARVTREELLREWDLDGDGSINKSEADVARARMRRKRLEMQLGAGIDPVTGLPRGLDGAADNTDPDTGDEPLFQLPPESPPSEPSRAKPESLPGMRAPELQPPAGPPAPRSQPATAPGSQPTATAPRSGRASWLPPQRLAPAVTGGVRAGAPAAAAGYGAAAWGDLNAGRRPLPSVPEEAGNAMTGSGGLLPSVRQPGRTGSMILPTLPGRATGAGVPSLPPPPPAGGSTRPRITADEIGAERP